MSSIERAGRCALLGLTNAGKSTLINALVGEKIAIVSHSAQTTRHRIIGVVEHRRSQIAFVDTPGLHRHKGRLNKRLMQATLRTLTGIDAAVFVAPVRRKGPLFDAEAQHMIERLAKMQLPCVLALNKIDQVAKPSLLPMLQQAAALDFFAGLVPLSALKKDGVEALLDEVAALMPAGDAIFPREQFTDQTERQLCGELIREQALRVLRQELPHALAVTIEQFDESQRDTSPGRVNIEATLWVERDSQKPIVIGAKGQTVKTIGTAARAEIESLLGCKVTLHQTVQVSPNWTDDARALQRLAVDSQDDA